MKTLDITNIACALALMAAGIPLVYVRANYWRFNDSHFQAGIAYIAWAVGKTANNTDTARALKHLALCTPTHLTEGTFHADTR